MKKKSKMKNNNKNEFNVRTSSIKFTKAKFSDAPLCRLHGINTEIVKHNQLQCCMSGGRKNLRNDMTK